MPEVEVKADGLKITIEHDQHFFVSETSIKTGYKSVAKIRTNNTLTLRKMWADTFKTHLQGFSLNSFVFAI
jgi:hypothetical protein